MLGMIEWQTDFCKRIKHPREVVALGVGGQDDLPLLEQVHNTFPMMITSHYAKLIDWSDSNDPLLRMVMPSVSELNRAGAIDVGDEAASVQDRGIQIKYPSTALVLTTNHCFSHCRFCFRRRLFEPNSRETMENVESVVSFISTHPSVDNVLLTGGDPLMLDTDVLKRLLFGLCAISHVRIIRLGTRALAYLPSRITSDPELIDTLRQVSLHDKKVYLVSHFNHSRELSSETGTAIDELVKVGVSLVNQSVLLKGVNDNPAVLRSLFNDLAARGIAPYYLFQCKFVTAAGHFRVQLSDACQMFNDSIRRLNGLAKRVRLVMAHASGKVEILGEGGTHTGEKVLYLRYHQARDNRLVGQVFCKRLPTGAYWLDDLSDIEEVK